MTFIILLGMEPSVGSNWVCKILEVLFASFGKLGHIRYPTEVQYLLDEFCESKRVSFVTYRKLSN